MSEMADRQVEPEVEFEDGYRQGWDEAVKQIAHLVEQSGGKGAFISTIDAAKLIRALKGSSK